MQGKLIVLEGLDGCGKATQAQKLLERLKNSGCRAMKISFPDYESESSALIKMYLSGKFGNAPDDVNAYAASTFFAVDRFASFKTSWGGFYNDGGIVVADRYTTSNAVHQCSKLPESGWDAYLDWLFDFEYEKIGIPSPDIVIYLHADVGISQKLMSERYNGDETRKDIHEGNPGYLMRSAAAAEYCANKYGWKYVECIRNGAMRSIEDISSEISAVVGQLL